MNKDSILAEGIKKRHNQSLEAAIDKHGKSVYALCARILGGLGKQQDIEECVSDTFLAAWQKINEFNGERGSFRTWLLMLARYKALDLRRQLSGNKEVADINDLQLLDTESGKEFTGIETREMLQQALANMEKTERELIYRRYYLFESVEQLAKDYNLTSRAVYNRLWRAKKALQGKVSSTRVEGVK